MVELMRVVGLIVWKFAVGFNMERRCSIIVLSASVQLDASRFGFLPSPRPQAEGSCAPAFVSFCVLVVLGSTVYFVQALFPFVHCSNISSPFEVELYSHICTAQDFSLSLTHIEGSTPVSRKLLKPCGFVCLRPFHTSMLFPRNLTRFQGTFHRPSQTFPTRPAMVSIF